MTKPAGRTQLARIIPLLIRGVAPTAAITFGFMPATTIAAPGDLDPAFGDFGRLGPIMDFAGPAWSAQLLATGATLIAGGTLVEECRDYFYCYYQSPVLHASNFLGQVTDVGALDSSFTPAALADTQVLDTALLPDGSIIAAGLKLVSNHPRLAVFKLSSAGVLDRSFGVDGVFELAGQGADHKATSVTVDPDGRIVAAGLRASPAALIVVRLQPNGAIDSTFGNSGVYTLALGDSVDSVDIIGTNDGYRVTSPGCSVIALTSAGALDPSFGTGGIANFSPNYGLDTSCYSLVEQPDGRLLAAGADGAQGFAIRLLANGTLDPGFSSSAVQAALSSVTAMAVAPDGTIVVAGSDAAGTPAPVVMRLQASGAMDTTFGRGGSTLIDLQADASAPVIQDLLLRADGAVIAAGGDNWSNQPFVVRLLGVGGPGVPGVLGVSQPSPTTNEQSPEAIVKVRRTGGAAGSVSVAYQTQAVDPSYGPPATVGQDYTDVSGRLSWADGDTSEQEIHVPIKADNVTEGYEYFQVKLSDVQGGAGLGTRSAAVQIDADGSPYGQFSIYADSASVAEGTQAQVSVSRDYYATGAVSVTVTPTAGTASAGTDFDATPQTVSWADGEGGTKTIFIAIPADQAPEANESFTVTLSNPTGGAVVGPTSSATVNITDAPPPPPSSNGGGGSMGFGALLMLAATGLLQRAWPRRRRAGR